MNRRGGGGKSTGLTAGGGESPLTHIRGASQTQIFMSSRQFVIRDRIQGKCQHLRRRFRCAVRD